MKKKNIFAAIAAGILSVFAFKVIRNNGEEKREAG